MSDDKDYRDRMECPMENLAVALWGYGDNDMSDLSDAQIVEIAARKISMLKEMLTAAGVDKKIVDLAVRT